MVPQAGFTVLRLALTELAHHYDPFYAFLSLSGNAIEIEQSGAAYGGLSMPDTDGMQIDILRQISF
jgi:hypothetical protein